MPCLLAKYLLDWLTPLHLSSLFSLALSEGPSLSFLRNRAYPFPLRSFFFILFSCFFFIIRINTWCYFLSWLIPTRMWALQKQLRRWWARLRRWEILGHQSHCARVRAVWQQTFAFPCFLSYPWGFGLQHDSGFNTAAPYQSNWVYFDFFFFLGRKMAE